MPLNYIEVGYDKIQLATGTRAEIEANKDKLNTYETAIVTDEDQLVYKDANGDIKDFTTGGLESKLDKSGGFMTGNIYNDIDDNVEGLMTFKRDAKLFQANSFVAGLKAEWIGESGVLGITRGEGTGIGIDGAKFKLQDDLYTLMHTGNCPISKSRSGWCKLPNGLILQWGIVSMNQVSQTQRVTFSFPISFSGNYCGVANSVSHLANTGTAIVSFDQVSQSTGYIQCPGGMWSGAITDIGEIFDAQWIAIGY